MNDLTTITNLITPEQNETAAIVFDALAPNTRRAYETNLKAFAAWIGNDQLTDPKLCEYLQYAFDCGKSPASLRMICAAVQWLCTSTDQPSPVGKRSKAKIKKLSEAGADRGRGQAKPLTYDNAVSMLTIGNPLDKAIVALAFMAGLRRSEIAALTWNDLEESENDNLLIHVRTSKTNRAGEDTDIRLLKNGFAKAVRDLRSGASEHDPVIGLKPQRISQRITALAKQAGITHKLTAHSGRVGLASELTARGASTTETMLAGNWKTARMVAHYSAGAKAQRGAVAKFL